MPSRSSTGGRRSRGKCRLAGTAPLAVALLAGLALPVEAQHEGEQDEAPWPLSNLVLTGYGYAGYGAELADDFGHDFNVHFAPIFLFDIGSDFLFSTELEFELHGDAVDFEMEYAQLSYLGFNRLILTAGKFLVPFGHFGERFHPAWINRMPSMPPLYAHAHGGVAPDDALLPVLTDVGALARYTLPAGENWEVDLATWISQGPAMVDNGDHNDDAHSPPPAHPRVPLTTGSNQLGSSAGAADPRRAARAGRQRTVYHEAADDDHDNSPFDIPTVAHGANFDSEGRNRQIGGGLGFVLPPRFEVYFSGFHARYDPDDTLDFVATNVAAEWRRGQLELRGEGVLLWQQFFDHEETAWLRSPAYYVQAARRFGSWEPVMRWSHLLDETVEGETAAHGREQLAVGLNYWFSPSVPLKAAYEWNRDGDGRLLLQWAVAF